MSSSYFKYCAVPSCESTSIETPDKLFIGVPNNKKMREKWLSFAGRKDAKYLSTKSRMYFCEDHFDLPNDMENYIEYHIMGKVGQVRMKTGCVPSKFICQEDTMEQPCGNKDNKYSYELRNQKKFEVSSSLEATACRISDQERNVQEVLTNHKENTNQSESSQSIPKLRPESLPNSHELITQHSLSNTMKRIEQQPLHYIGILNTYHFLTDLIINRTDIPKHHLILCLNKIKQNVKFKQLTGDYGMSALALKKVFFKNIPQIARVLRQSIIRLDSEIIRKTLPSTFKHVHNNVSYIITCIEIPIQKPSDKLLQALTWSQSKKGFTVKYLISFTPSGLINYVSSGFGGRTTDTSTVELCDFGNSLQCGDIVIADNKFENIEPILKASGIAVVRPNNEIEEKFNLNIPIGKVVKRLQQFDMLKSNASIEFGFVKILDDIVTIVCALINLQDCL